MGLEILLLYRNLRPVSIETREAPTFADLPCVSSDDDAGEEACRVRPRPETLPILSDEILQPMTEKHRTSGKYI